MSTRCNSRKIQVPVNSRRVRRYVEELSAQVTGRRLCKIGLEEASWGRYDTWIVHFADVELIQITACCYRAGFRAWQPDHIWKKFDSVSVNHYLFSRLQISSKGAYSSRTAAASGRLTAMRLFADKSKQQQRREDTHPGHQSSDDRKSGELNWSGRDCCALELNFSWIGIDCAAFLFGFHLPKRMQNTRFVSIFRVHLCDTSANATRSTNCAGRWPQRKELSLHEWKFCDYTEHWGNLLLKFLFIFFCSWV